RDRRGRDPAGVQQRQRLGTVLSPGPVHERVHLRRVIREEGMNDRGFSAPRLNRRQMLQRMGAGFGSLALAALLADEAAATPTPPDPLARRLPHFPARAKRVIFLFMPGGPSQVDTFDPKPRLTKDHGNLAPKLYLGQKRKLLASPWTFQQRGQSGLE